MYICRLFHRDQPFEQVEARLLTEDGMTIGRDPTADWPLSDAAGMLSRIHCSLNLDQGRVLLRDTSTNGTFLDNGERAPRDLPIEIGLRQSIRLGELSILIDKPDTAAGAVAATHVPVVPPTDWMDTAPAPRAPHRDASLLEAFCQGARLDASAFSAEDPNELMRRVGAVYQQTILGLATLMAERARLKAQCELERTMISAADNNPFKWTPTRRLAQDLLTGGAAGFLSDAEAVRACFEDLGLHLAAVARGVDAATDLTLQTLAPQAIEAEAKLQASLLKSKAAVCWDIHNQRHAALVGEGGAVARAFNEAYSHAAEAVDR